MSEIKEAQLPNGDVVQFKDAVAREAMSESEIDEICTPIPTEDGLLPIATKAALGCVKVGDGLEIDENGMLSANIPPTATDYIVEHGTTGIWQYRKWNSGIAECWAAPSITIASSAWKSWGSIYYAMITTKNTITYPQNFFIQPPQHNLTPAVYNGNCWIQEVSGTSTKDNPPDLCAYAPVASGSAFSVLTAFHAVGKWK